MLDFLKKEGIHPHLIQELEQFRSAFGTEPEVANRIRTPRYYYYGTKIWEEALSALLCGEHLLLTGPKATGKNVLAENLAPFFMKHWIFAEASTSLAMIGSICIRPAVLLLP